MRFRPGGLVVGPGRATRRGYQRAAGPPQSTGGQRTPANGGRFARTLPGSCPGPCSPAAATCWPTRSAPAAWARSGARGTATSAAGSRPSWLAPTTPPPSSGSRGSEGCGCGTATSCSPSGRAGDLFTMDLVRGGDLEQLLARHGPLPDSYVRVVLDQVLEALVAVHAAGLVHRDVKPGNLLLEPTGTGRPWVRLGDFGIAVACRRAPAHASTRRRRHRRLHASRAGRRRPARPAAGRVRRGRGRDPAADRAAAGWARSRHARWACCWRRSPHPEPGRRPATAAAALDLLRALGVPAGAPWQADPDPPDVRCAARRPAGADAVRLGRRGRLRRRRAGRRPRVVGAAPVSLRPCRRPDGVARPAPRPRSRARRCRWPGGMRRSSTSARPISDRQPAATMHDEGRRPGRGAA